MKLLIVTLFLISASAFKLRDSEGTSQVVGGEKAKQGQFPYIVSIQYEDYGHYCGGAIVNSKWVVTAAHCLHDFKAEKMTVVAGELNLVNESGYEHSTTVERTVIYDWYDPSTLMNDIGLMRVTDGFRFNKNIRSIPLNHNSTESGDGTVAGWGSTGDEYPVDLYNVVLPIVTEETCKKAMGSQVTYTNICAGRKEGGVGACYADSGGPLITKRNGIEVLTGLVSFGPHTCGAANYYSVFTEISVFDEWIEDNTY